MEGDMQTITILLAFILLSGWYVNCDEFDQLPIRAHSETIWDIPCTGEGEEDANHAYFRARSCADDMGLLRFPWGEVSQIGLRICVTGEPFTCPGLPDNGPVAECAGSYAGGSAFVFVAKSWPDAAGYSFDRHLRLGVLNLLVWTGAIDLPLPEEDLRADHRYEALIARVNSEMWP
jgi:hypothetical protein